jgi:hypothetical protein
MVSGGVEAPMFDLRKQYNTYNLGLALKNQTGQFHVINPDGTEMLVTSEAGHSITDIEWLGDNAQKPFVVTKVAEPVTTAEVPTIQRRTG